jgi:hypothetical protein
MGGMFAQTQAEEEDTTGVREHSLAQIAKAILALPYEQVQELENLLV